MVDEVLGRLRRFLDNTQREQAGELSQEIESSERVSELTGVSDTAVSLDRPHGSEGRSALRTGQPSPGARNLG